LASLTAFSTASAPVVVKKKESRLACGIAGASSSISSSIGSCQPMLT